MNMNNLNDFIKDLKEVLDLNPADVVAGDIELDGKTVRIELSYKRPLPWKSRGGNLSRIKDVLETASTEVEEVNPILIER